MINDPIPYALDSWYPVVRGGSAPRFSFDALDGHTSSRLPKAWSAMADGERLVLRGSASPGSRTDLKPLETTLRSTGTVERFVVFPGTGGSFTLLPTVDGSALRGGMALLPSGRARGRALWAAVKTLSPLGVAKRLGMPELAIWTKGSQDRSVGDLPVLPVAGSIAVLAGVPDRSQKIVVRALDRRGVARAILKIGQTERSDDAVRREALALERLPEHLEGRAPKLLATGERNGRAWMAQEALQGRRSGDLLTPEHAALLTELILPTREEVPLGQTPCFLESIRVLERLDSSLDPDWTSEYEALAAALRSSSADELIPVAWAHGDFTPWNTLTKRGHLSAFDWEYFHERAPILHDAIHFFVQTSVLVRQHKGERIFDELEGFFRGPARDVVQATDMTRADVLRSLGLYVLHEGVMAEALERADPAPFEQAAWLRHARRALCRRLAGLLAERALPAWIPGRVPSIDKPGDPGPSAGTRHAA